MYSQHFFKKGFYSDCSILISISTPAGRLRLESDSIVWDVVSVMSISRECVRISNWSRDFLCTKVDLFTVNFSTFVGRGIGPATMAPVLSALSMMSFEVSSITL